MKKDGIFISRKNIRIISFFLGLGVFIWSFLVFEQNIETRGTDKEWKFYVSLIGFIGISSIFLLSTISLVTLLIRKFRDKKKDKIFISIKNLFIISFVLGLGAFAWSLLVFEQNTETLGTDKERGFYASLLGFIICSLMFLLSTISLVTLLIRKFRDKLDNAS